MSIIAASLLTSITAVVVSGSRGAAGLGLVVAPPVIQLLFAQKYLPLSTIKKALLAIIVSVIAYIITMFIRESEIVKPLLDYYDYFDYLLIYTMLSIASWEVCFLLIKRR